MAIIERYKIIVRTIIAKRKTEQGKLNWKKELCVYNKFYLDILSSLPKLFIEQIEAKKPKQEIYLYWNIFGIRIYRSVYKGG